MTLTTSDLAVQRLALRVKQGGHNIPTTQKPTRAISEQARIDVALKQAAAHARKQLAAQGIPIPCWTFGCGTALMLRHEHQQCCAAKARLPAVFAQ